MQHPRVSNSSQMSPHTAHFDWTSVVLCPVQALFDFRFQVMPFIYTHLVSFSTALYLICMAFMKLLVFAKNLFPSK